MKPPFAYYGGKTTLAERIVALFGPHGHYVEPFAGSLAVLLAKPASRMETVNDLDHDLMTFWRVLRDRPDALARACALTPHSRAELAACHTPAHDEIEQARRVWVRIAQTRTGTLRRTGWRHYVDPSGSSASMPGYLAAYVERMAAVAERLAAVSLECRPALEVIDAYGRHPNVLLYADPPYLGSTRARNYRHEMTSENEHRELADALRAAQATVVLSGYDSPLYQKLYADWTRITIPTTTGQTHTRRARVEVLWLNQPPPTGDLLSVLDGASA
ncbi:DNA adenine methylase [Frankia sp. Cppng1_Ct_nod]|uniref:DNA adenine methylase n=1 Tax=Frankia sp. Cppng1_Ct_nod TaxID=2897162 RepID=UPI001041A522